jgi:hypothetical protein
METPGSAQFEEWVAYVFDKPVAERAWYWDEEILELSPRSFIEYGTRLFKNAGKVLAAYDDGQINQGLNLLLSNNISNQIFALHDQSIPVEQRVAFIEAILDLARDVFEVRCTLHLSHLDRHSTPDHVSPLNMICYMLWDIFIVYGNRDKAMEPLNRASLKVIERALKLKNWAVIEGALHGLGHFEQYYPEETRRIADTYLSTANEWPRELVAYAMAARDGCIL